MSHINRSVFPQLKMTYYSVCDFLMKAVHQASLSVCTCIEKSYSRARSDALVVEMQRTDTQKALAPV